MTTGARTQTPTEETERALLGQIEVHSIDWIPDPERHGKNWQQTMLWFLGNFQFFTIPIGFLGPEMGLSLGWSILAGFLGVSFGTLFMAFHATQGPVFGLPQMIQTRAQMGYRGVVVALFAVLFTYMAFNVADQVLMSSGLHATFGWSTGLVAGGTAILAALLAIFGYDWVHRVFRFLLVISLPCYLIISFAILFGGAGGSAPSHPGGFVFAAFMSQFTLAAAYNITYAPYVSDYSRYMPRKTSPLGIVAAVFFGASGSAVWLTAIDSFRKITTSRLWRAATIVVLALIWYLLGRAWSSASAVTAVLDSLTLMLYLLVPWTALNLVDYFFVRHGHYAITDIFRLDGVYRRWGWRGLTAYFAGFACEIPFMVILPIGGFSFTGPVPAHLTNGVDYAWVAGLLVSGLLYLLLCRSLDTAAEQVAIDASDRELQAIDAAAAAAA